MNVDKIVKGTNYLISVIIPVYNTEKYLSECIDSVLAQNINGVNAIDIIEIIIVNDGSPDSSNIIINEYARRYSNIVAVHQENAGQSVARNNAIDIARGEYIYFLDSDDLLPPRALASLYKLSINTGSDVVITHCKAFNSRRSWFIDDHAEVASSSFRQVKFSHRSILMNTPGPVAKLYRKSLLIKHHIRFPLGIKIGEDWIFVLSAMYHANHISSSPDITYLYRAREDEHNPSCTQVVNEKVFLDFIEVYKLTYQFNLPERQTRLAKLFVIKGILYRLEKYSSEKSLSDCKKIYKLLGAFFREHIGADIINIFTPQRRLVMNLIYHSFYTEAFRVLNKKIKSSCLRKAIILNNENMISDYHSIKKANRKRKLTFYKKKFFKFFAKYKWSIKYDLARVLSGFIKSDNIVLIGERLGQTANDTSFFLFKKISEQRTKNKFYYVINKNSPTKNNLDGFSNVLHYGSLKHFIYFHKACTYVYSDTLRDIFHHWPEVYKDHLHKKKIFLQHGIFATSRAKGYYDRNSMLRRNELPDKFVVSSAYEGKLLQRQFGFQKNEIAITGLTRFDYLPKKQNKKRRKILLMPTWREWLTNVSDENFLKSEYYKKITELFSPPVIDLLKKYNYTLDICIHHQLKKHLDNFKLNYSNVNFFCIQEVNVQELIILCDMMVTDYSSASFDVLYQNKPVIYYHFDAARFFATRGGPLICPLTEFPGPVPRTFDDLIKEMELLLIGNCCPSTKYIKSANKFFDYKDNNNSKRVLQLIESEQ
ncbi:CDP-glycerol glycerophosphotransferase family protein [Franconibacter helveticus]|uniref:bifunctional glycosyltransferase/CDP-glycerol:glycerophosphate glycerophosphotransferase n=1 Tax=Franconibacter helveticus TaxID=357240 RepID=UPI00290C44C5|nr:CDP-glycerol glycerophosphotransferase family protein [Franconibacter helveticus]MDU6924747.1 CDP-glycerol glycerophosphotransferase family protein [Franconibacter helveticus]